MGEHVACQSGIRTRLGLSRTVSSCSSWLLWSTSLDWESDDTDIWGKCFGFGFCSLNREGTENGGERTKTEGRWTSVHVSPNDFTTKTFLGRGHLSDVLSLWWFCEKLFSGFLTWMDLFVDCFFMQRSGTMFIFLLTLLESPPVWVRIGVTSVKQPCVDVVLSTLQTELQLGHPGETGSSK